MENNKEILEQKNLKENVVQSETKPEVKAETHKDDKVNDKKNKNFISRPKDWPRVPMGLLRKKFGMLNDAEFKLVILTCKDVKTAEEVLDTLRKINGKDEQNLYMIIYKCLTYIMLKAPNVDVKFKDGEVVTTGYVDVEDKGTVRDNPQHLNHKDQPYVAPSVEEKKDDVNPNDIKEEPNRDCDGEEIPDDPVGLPEDDSEDPIKDEEQIEDEAEEYAEYEDMKDENNERNARPGVKKSEQFK